MEESNRSVQTSRDFTSVGLPAHQCGSCPQATVDVLWLDFTSVGLPAHQCGSCPQATVDVLWLDFTSEEHANTHVSIVGPVGAKGYMCNEGRYRPTALRPSR